LDIDRLVKFKKGLLGRYITLIKLFKKAESKRCSLFFNLDRILIEVLDLAKRILYISLMKQHQAPEIFQLLIFGTQNLLKVGLLVKDQERGRFKSQMLDQVNIVQNQQAYLALLSFEESTLVAQRSIIILALDLTIFQIQKLK